MIDMLSFVSLQVFPTLIVDIFKYLSIKKLRVLRTSRFA